MSPIPIDTDTSSEVACVSLKPSGEDVNTTITTTPVRITTVENYTQASSTVTVLTSNSFSCILVDHAPKAMRDTAAKRSISKARLLTNAESLALLQEKEEKKQKALEEKEQKWKEREEKKKLREQEAKKKAEEKTKKAEEKARKAAQKEAEKTKKAEQLKGVKTNTRKRKAPQPEASSNTTSKRSNTTTDVVESRSESSAAEANTTGTSAVSTTGLTVSEGFDPNVYCIYVLWELSR